MIVTGWSQVLSTVTLDFWLGFLLSTKKTFITLTGEQATVKYYFFFFTGSCSEKEDHTDLGSMEWLRACSWTSAFTRLDDMLLRPGAGGRHGQISSGMGPTPIRWMFPRLRGDGGRGRGFVLLLSRARRNPRRLATGVRCRDQQSRTPRPADPSPDVVAERVV